MPVTRFTWLAVAACLAGNTILHAQKGRPPKPEPTDTPVVAFLGNDGRLAPPQSTVDWVKPGDACDSLGPAPAPTPGAINGDELPGDERPYVGDTFSNSGAFLRYLDGEFHIDIRAGSGRWVYIYFTDPRSVPASPKKDFCAVALEQFNLHTHFLHEDGTDDVALGLVDIAPGHTHPVRILSNFQVGETTYQIRFNADHYPGSTNVKVTRGKNNDETPGLPNDQWWRIETGVGAVNSGLVAQLLSPSTTKKGNAGPNDEGRYALPFEIVFTTDFSILDPE